ncbi:hypothetical protein BV20DRAFT_1053779 [Pilatotrama ljubarskyi]|nr:hypothetical protein BV20DRAFT_1053779 [Pilatotrama ljubarskyi]
MLAAGLLTITLTFIAPLSAVARPAPKTACASTGISKRALGDTDLFARGGHDIFVPPECDPSIFRRGDADGQDAVGQDGGDGADGQDAVGADGADGADGQDAVCQNGGVSTGGGDGSVDIPGGMDGTIQVAGHTIVIQGGHVVSVDGQPVSSGAAGTTGQDGQDGTATAGNPGTVIGSGSANGGTAIAGKGGKGGKGGVAIPGKPGTVIGRGGLVHVGRTIAEAHW